jgi:hypothetical protein
MAVAILASANVIVLGAAALGKIAPVLMMVVVMVVMVVMGEVSIV